MSTATFHEEVGTCGLHTRTPYLITDVSRTQLSVARHYGGMIFNSERYTYNPITDELVRDDVLKWHAKQKKAAKAKRAKHPEFPPPPSIELAENGEPLPTADLHVGREGETFENDQAHL